MWLTMTPIYQLAEIFTSATNFLIYCIVGGKFRKELYGIFEKKEKMKNNVLVPCNLQTRAKPRAALQTLSSFTLID